LPLGAGVDKNIIFLSFMIGFISHLVMDMLTKEGVPLLFPLPIHFGFPPFKFLRIRTNGIAENLLITPGIIAGVFALGYMHPENALLLLRGFGLK
jgi:inner membrane protein